MFQALISWHLGFELGCFCVLLKFWKLTLLPDISNRSLDIFQTLSSEAILESNGMPAIFLKKGKKMAKKCLKRAKKGRLFDNFWKNVHNLKANSKTIIVEILVCKIQPETIKSKIFTRFNFIIQCQWLCNKVEICKDFRFCYLWLNFMMLSMWQLETQLSALPCI